MKGPNVENIFMIMSCLPSRAVYEALRINSLQNKCSEKGNWAHFM